MENPNDTPESEVTAELSADEIYAQRMQEAAQEGEPEETDEEAEEPTVTIDGKEYTLAEAKELISKGTDYTKKTQDLAQIRKEAEEWATIKEMLQDPEEADRALEILQGVAVGVKKLGTPARTTQNPDIDLDYLTENELAIYQAGQARIDALEAFIKKQLGDVSSVLGDIKPVIEETQRAKAAKLAVSEVKSTLGIDWDYERIEKAMQEQGVSDPIKAVKLATYEDRAKESFQKGHQQGQSKPKGPQGIGSNEFDPDNLSADEIFAQLQAGKITRK